MSKKESGKQAAVSEQPKENRQLHCIVGGCKITLNFPMKPGGSAISDIKRMMLGGVVKP